MNILNSEIVMNIFGLIVAVSVLSVLVAVHEAGHLLMAKWSNIRVDVFSIGMGKPIWGFQYGETYYQIGQLPFGGFCGFGDEETSDTPDKDPRSLMNSPLWSRLLTIIGGSLFNILFAYLVMILMYRIGFNEIHLSNIIAVPQTIEIGNSDEEIPSPAYVAGLRSGDMIIGVNGRKVKHFMQITSQLSISGSSQKNITFIRGKNIQTVTVSSVFNSSTGQDIIGVQPVKPNIISIVSENSPAQLAGLLAEDEIKRINGLPITFFHELETHIQKGKSMFLGIKRGEQEKVITVQPIQEGKLWTIGVKSEYPQEIKVHQQAANLFQAVVMAHDNVSQTISQIRLSIGKLFSGKMDVQKNLSGPIRIVSVAGSIAKTLDIVLIMKFLVMLSLALAVFNMLPFPGLDGGALILQTARSIFKNNHKAEQFIGFVEQFGVMLLLVFAVFVMFNDIKNIFSEKKSEITQDK